jgi:hypothetical protein
MIGYTPEEFGTADDYFQALQELLGEGVSPKHLAMLKEHLHSLDHTSTWWQLADKVGYPSFNAVNLQYGKLAERVARKLGRDEKPEVPGGYPDRAWVWVLVVWADQRGAGGDTAFVLRPEVVEALERLDQFRG